MVAIIPARGGSKGVQGKNIKLLCGKPLIAYTIEAAKAAKRIDRIVLSTDDTDIAQIARAYNVDIPFMRPKELAQDDSRGIDTYIYTIDKLNKELNNHYDEFIVLQPTSPLRMPEDIDNAIELFYKNNANAVIACVMMPHPPTWARKINKDGKIENYFNIDIENKNRQEFESAYLPNGAIYILKYSFLTEKYAYYSDKTYAYLMPPERSIDIDTELDFKLAELLIKERGSSAL
jgi:N-acylneuraminate cytidylyltransferase/CMP-N,N'-diacetyllegionaminic acid synthase